MPSAEVKLTDKELAAVIACVQEANTRIIGSIKKAAANDQITKAYEGKDLFEVLDSALEKLVGAFRDIPKLST